MESLAFGGFKPPEGVEIKDTLLPYYGISMDWLLMLFARDMPAHLVQRLWDTYLCEGKDVSEGFSSFHAYVCAAFLIRFSSEIQEFEMEGEIAMFFKARPGN